jgi:dTDP-4-amino-4,6-dideoxygalactose transaminase
MGESAPIVVPFQRPSFPDLGEVERYFHLARQAHWYSNDGPCLRLLAERLEARTGSHCLPVASGMAALMVAIAAVGARRTGREALVPAFTFPAGPQALVWNGYEPVFLDIDPGHLHLSPTALEQALAERGSRVGIVLATSSFGTPPPPPVRRAWERAAAAAGVPLVVDSAAGFGAVAADGLPLGSQGDVEIVSFHATKPFAIGEGGAIFSRDRGIIDTAHRLANFSYDEDHQLSARHGLNVKLDELHAAVALAVLDGFDEGVLGPRRRAAGELLRGLGEAVAFQEGHELGTYQFVSVLCPDDRARQRVLERADGRVELRSYYQPLHETPAFAGASRHGALDATRDAGSRILSLPMHNSLSAAERDVIVDVVALG